VPEANAGVGLVPLVGVVLLCWRLAFAGPPRGEGLRFGILGLMRQDRGRIFTIDTAHILSWGSLLTN
jgi:hypothetical protein